MAWLSGWGRRKKLTVTGTTAGAQTDFQLMLDVVYDSDMLANFDDLRFTLADGTTLIDFWLESKVDSTSAVVWVEVPSIPANPDTVDIYMYYGKADAASASNGTNTFLFFDDFVGSSIDTSKWTIVDSTGFSVANSELRGTSTTGLLNSIANITPGSILETRIRGISGNVNSMVPIAGYLSADSGLGFYWGNAAPDWGFHSFYANTAATNYQWTVADSQAIFQIIMKPDNTNILNKLNYNSSAFIQTSPSGTITKTISAGTKIRVGRRIDDSYTGQAYEVYWDWVRVRKYASPEPTYGTGSEENPGIGWLWNTSGWF